MDIIDILDNKVKDKIKEKNELEEIIKGLKIEINEYKNNMDSLKKKNDFYIGVADSRRDGTVKGK